MDTKHSDSFESIDYYFENKANIIKSCELAVIDLMFHGQEQGSRLCKYFIKVGVPVLVSTALDEKDIPETIRTNNNIKIILKKTFSKTNFIEILKTLPKSIENTYKHTILCLSDLHFRSSDNNHVLVANPP